MQRTILRRMSALVIAMLIVLSIGIINPTTVLANNEITVAINGVPVVFVDQGPIIVQGRTLVPIRGVFEALGFYPTWNGAARQATLTRGNDVIVITIDSSTFTTNGVRHTLDVPAQIVGGRTLVPLRAVLESVGYTLTWDGATSTAHITYGPAVRNDFYFRAARELGWEPFEFEGISFYISPNAVLEEIVSDGRAFIRIPAGTASIVISSPIAFPEYDIMTLELFEANIASFIGPQFPDNAVFLEFGLESGFVGTSFSVTYTHPTQPWNYLTLFIFYDGMMLSVSGRIPPHYYAAHDDFIGVVMIIAGTVDFN